MAHASIRRKAIAQKSLCACVCHSESGDKPAPYRLVDSKTSIMPIRLNTARSILWLVETLLIGAINSIVIPFYAIPQNSLCHSENLMPVGGHVQGQKLM
jgi:hypothetical protein